MRFGYLVLFHDVINEYARDITKLAWLYRGLLCLLEYVYQFTKTVSTSGSKAEEYLAATLFVN